MKNDDDDNLVYVISDIDKFVNETRKIIFGGFGQTEDDEDATTLDELIDNLTESDIEELDQTLTQDECISILHDYVKPRKTKNGKKKYVINEEQFNQIIDAFNARLVSNLLTNLVNKGLIESAYDNEENDFIFWIPSNEDENKKS